MKVGIFDSGIGGLSVLHHALQVMPETDFIYYADEAHVPYGEKTREQIKGYIDEIIDFMLRRQVDAIVIACNTATSVATKEYRDKFPVPIIGMEPAVKQAVEAYGDLPGRILAAATPVTIAGDKLQNLLEKVDQEHDVDLIALPKLVRFAETGDFETALIREYLLDALKDYPIDEYKALVLGCTHFNYFKEYYKEIFPENTRFVDGNAGTIRQLLRMLPKKPQSGDSSGNVEYFFSGKPVTLKEREKIQRYLEQLDKMKDI